MSVTWYNFRISKSISEAILELTQDAQKNILATLSAHQNGRLFFINGMTVVQTFRYNYKNAREAKSDNSISFSVGGIGFSFDGMNSTSTVGVLPDQIVGVFDNNLGGYTQVQQIFDAAKTKRVDAVKALVDTAITPPR